MRVLTGMRCRKTLQSAHLFNGASSGPEQQDFSFRGLVPIRLEINLNACAQTFAHGLNGLVALEGHTCHVLHTVPCRFTPFYLGQS